MFVNTDQNKEHVSVYSLTRESDRLATKFWNNSNNNKNNDYIGPNNALVLEIWNNQSVMSPVATRHLTVPKVINFLLINKKNYFILSCLHFYWSRSVTMPAFDWLLQNSIGLLI